MGVCTGGAFHFRVVSYTQASQDILPAVAGLPTFTTPQEVPLARLAQVGVGLTTLADRVLYLRAC